MIHVNEVEVKRILNPTSIDLGEFVINPYMGCEFACLYCYVRSNRVVVNRNMQWGQFVDVRINAPQSLEIELTRKKPECVLLGSTTECFQPIEKKYKLTQNILKILNKHQVEYVILTRSPVILDYIPLLKEGYCRKIYFTVNNYPPALKNMLEPKSPDFSIRDKAVEILIDEGLTVIPYFSPILPWVSKMDDVFGKYENASQVEFECLNFQIPNIDQILVSIETLDPSLKTNYMRMLRDEKFFRKVWKNITTEIANLAVSAGKAYKIYTHNFGDFFSNTYGIRNKL